MLIATSSACVATESGDTASSPLTGATTVVSLTFDDTLADQFQVGAMLEQRGLVGTFYVNSGRLGSSGYMSRDQLLTLQNAGHEIAGHTISHANLTSVSATEARRQVCDDRVALLNAGLRITTFAYPFGADSSTVRQMVAACGYNAARDVGGLVTPGSCSGCPYANTIPPAEPYALRTSDSVKSTTTLATLQGYVTQAEAHGGGFVPIVFHHVCDGCATDSVSPATLAAFADWLATRGPATQVATVDAVIGGVLQPPVPAATDTTPPSLTASCNGGTCSPSSYMGGVRVVLAGSDSGSGLREVRYTTDGSDPATGAVYTAPFVVTTSSTVRALALDNAGNRATQTVPLSVTPPSADGDLLSNASLELDANANSVPDCWVRTSTSSGRNSASYALVSDAYTGSVAQQITMTSWSRGTRGLAVVEDLGACAPYATPGHSYTVTAYYKASTSIAFNVRYRTTSGAWSSLADSPAFAAAATYQQATYTIPGLPADATGISVGVSIGGLGTVTMDALSLVDGATPPPPQDTTPPALAISCDGATCAATPYPSAVTVELAATDADSGVREVRYTTDGTDPASGLPYTGPITVATSTTLRATAVDNAGNRTGQSVTILVGTAPPPPTNLLQNASLESDANNDGIPDCWRRDGYGTNAATYTLVSDAFDGLVAQQLDITSWSSGGRRLASAQDSGTCAPAVTPGRRYTASAYYRSSAAPRVSVFYRNSAGVWSWFAESPLLPTSASYVQASYTTPPMPADATHISIGVSIFGTGSITTDAYSLVEAP